VVQVQKLEVRARIASAALEVFAERVFRGATMPEIARRAGVAPANLYRYHADKQALFDAVVPTELAARHVELLTRSARSLASLATGLPTGPTQETQELLAFWIAHRLAVVVLLDRAADTRYARYGAEFVTRLVEVTVSELRAQQPGLRLSKPTRQVLTILFDNTRRALALILEQGTDPAAIREGIEAFRSYQIAGIAGFVRWVRRLP
jgi:AcrR family transcriptional regulator